MTQKIYNTLRSDFLNSIFLPLFVQCGDCPEIYTSVSVQLVGNCKGKNEIYSTIKSIFSIAIISIAFARSTLAEEIVAQQEEMSFERCLR